jgi:hypothetical protein
MQPENLMTISEAYTGPGLFVWMLVGRRAVPMSMPAVHVGRSRAFSAFLPVEHQRKATPLQFRNVSRG